MTADDQLRDEVAAQLIELLAAADYSTVRILGVECDRDHARKQAMLRRWTGRTKWIGADPDHPLGGRFVSPEQIDRCYPATGLSRCARNALDLFKRARSGEIADAHLTIFKPAASGELEALIEDEVHT